MTELEKLPDDLKHLISAKLIPYDLNNLRATNKSNRTLQKKPLYYSSNHEKFIKAYSDALKFAGKQQTCLISKKIPELQSLINYYSEVSNSSKPIITLSNNRRYTLSGKEQQKKQIYNKGILIYLQILKKGDYNHYIYGLALLISAKSCLRLFNDEQKHKYRTIEFELYKLYIMSYLVKRTQHYDMKHLQDASYMIKHYSEKGIPEYVSVADPQQQLCANFIRYYFNINLSTHKEFNNLLISTKDPFIKNDTDIYEQCLDFMIKEGKYVSVINPKSIDLSLIE
jgi:hypothetical protein